MFQKADRLNRAYVRDAIAPRFFNTTLDDYVRACSAKDWEQARRAFAALEHFAKLRGHRRLTSGWKLAVTRNPRLFRALMAINERLPRLVRWRTHPAVRLRQPQALRSDKVPQSPEADTAASRSLGV
jgi:hypothetical protein